MKDVLGWEPLVWTVRSCGIILVVLATYISMLYAARYLRPKTIRAMVTADPPSFRNASLEAFGAKIGGELDVNQQQGGQLGMVMERIEQLEQAHAALRGVVVRILRRQPRDGGTRPQPHG